MNINYFENARSKTPRTTTLDRVVASLHNSLDLQAKTDEYRDHLRQDPDTAAQMKRSFGGFLPAALVSESRKRENVTALTGLMMCDFDHVPTERLAELRLKANADPHTVLTYVTLSGSGLRVLAAYEVPEMKNDVKTYEDFYKGIFAAINEHYAQLLGVAYDPACKDLTRLSFVAFDTEAFYRPDARRFEASMASTKEKKRKQQKKEQKERNRRLLRINDTYHFRIQPSLKADGAKYAPGSHNNYVMRVGYQMNKYGFELEDVQAWALKEFSDYPEATRVIEACYSNKEEHGTWADQLERSASTDNGKMPKATCSDIILFLSEKVEIRFNVVKGVPEIRWLNPPYNGISSQLSRDRRAFTQHTDPIVYSLLCLMEKERGLDASSSKMYEYIGCDLIPDYDPLQAFMHSLPPWDPDKDPDYIKELADTVHVIDDDPRAQDLFYRCL